MAWLVVESDTAGDMGASARTLDRLSPVYRDQRVGAVSDRRRHAGAACCAAERATVIAHLGVAGDAGWVRSGRGGNPSAPQAEVTFVAACETLASLGKEIMPFET